MVLVWSPLYLICTGMPAYEVVSNQLMFILVSASWASMAYMGVSAVTNTFIPSGYLSLSGNAAQILCACKGNK